MSFEDVMSFKDDLTTFKGSDPVILKMKNGEKDVRLLCPAPFWVKADNDFVHTLENKYKDRVKIEVKSLDEN